MRPQAGQVINNKYRLMRLIGDGGMGSVYEARHEVLGTTVALKFLHPELSRRSGLVQRFLQEARVSAQIQSPHVVRVVDVDQTAGGLAFIVMEYLEGKTLQMLYEELYRAGVRLSYGDALEYAIQMLEGVEAAHRAGVVHRDLKPDNVMITRTAKNEPLLKLLDFGIAKLKVTGELHRGLTRPGVIMGTPEYMAPEQAYSADTVDARADIFSLGVMIFEMLGGRRPVGGDEPQQIAGAYLSGQISRLSDLAPELAPGLCAAVHRAMAAVPAERFATAAAFREAMQPFAHAARAPSAMTPAPPDVGPLRGPAVAPPAAGAAAFLPGAAPATNAPSDGGYSAVPKTIPPEGEARQAANSALLSARPSTPMGGFASDARSSADSAPAFTPLSGSTPSAYAPMANAFPIAQGAPLPATVSAAPYPGSQNSSGFVAPPPEPAAFDVSPRPGGTAIGDAPLYVSREAAPSGAFNGSLSPAYSGKGSTQAYLPGTAPMDPLPSRAAVPGGTARRPAKRGPPLAVILLLAAGVAGIVMGGVYFANELGKPELRTEAPLLAPTQGAVTVPADPPTTNVATTPPAPVSTQPKPRPTAAARPPQPMPTQPSPTQPTPSAKPSGTTLLPQLPPIIIPSSLPFPLPLPPGAQTPSPQPQPSEPPAPAPSSTGRPRRPGTVILVPNN